MTCNFWRHSKEKGLEWFENIGRECYKYFPFQVRVRLASWLEPREDWITEIANPDDPDHASDIFGFLMEMTEEFQKSCFEFPDVNDADIYAAFKEHVDRDWRQETLSWITLKANVLNLGFFHLLTDALKKEREMTDHTVEDDNVLEETDISMRTL